MSMSFDFRIAADVSGPIAAWRDRFVSSVGEAKYRRAAGWAVDEVAKTAVVSIRAQFHKTLKRNSPWTMSAIRYNRSSKAGLNAIGQGNGAGIFASVEVMPKQSTYLKYLFGLGDNTGLPGDVGLAQNQILIPWWDNIKLTQGVQPTAYGGVPTGFLARLAREVQDTRAPKRSGTQSGWGVYKGTITIHGQPRLAYIARPPRVASETESMWTTSGRRGGGMVWVGRRMVNTDHPRVLFLAVDRATYKPILEKPWQEACAEAAARIPQIMAAQFADNLAHAAAKRGSTRMAA